MEFGRECSRKVETSLRDLPRKDERSQEKTVSQLTGFPLNFSDEADFLIRTYFAVQAGEIDICWQIRNRVNSFIVYSYPDTLAVSAFSRQLSFPWLPEIPASPKICWEALSSHARTNSLVRSLYFLYFIFFPFYTYDST